MVNSHARKNTSGFTLIELLVVVAIIGVLASVVLAFLSDAREKAKISKAKTEVGQIMRAAELVYNDYGYYPNDSHGSIVCPKDIVIDSVSGTTWGAYINICNGPWGNPYEWDNQCSGGGTRKPHAPFDPSCPSFSDASPGSIGVTVVGPDNTNNGCTGDDLCIGDRGHAIYGWDGQVTQSGGGSGPMCVTTVSSCSGLSALGCISRTGCTLGSYGCTGSYTGSCTTFADQTSCSASTGCSWSSGGCGGTAPNCSTYGDSSSCGTASGCSWSTSGGSCGGSAGACNLTNYADQTSCQGAGCTWGSGGGSCTGSYNCTQWHGTNSSTCLTNHPGCQWSPYSGGRCTNISGNPSCSSLSQSTCTPTGCTWSSSGNSCTGSPNTCFSYGSSGSCGGAVGCSWSSSSSCVGTADCNYGDSSSCSAGGCTWGASSCQGTYGASCSSFGDQTSCQTQGTCTWSSGTCTGTASSCTSYVDQNSCVSQSGCSWQ